MKIWTNKDEGKINFSNIVDGDTFYYKDLLFMKLPIHSQFDVDNLTTSRFNSINLASGFLYDTPLDAKVIPVDTVVVTKEQYTELYEKSKGE